MKLAYTKTPLPYGIHVEAIGGADRYGYAITLKGGQEIVPADGQPAPAFSNPRIEITEELIRSKTSPKELVDATNLYLELNLVNMTIGRVFNKFAETLLDRAGGGTFLYKHQMSIFGQVYIPFADSPVQDWAFRINGNPDIGIEVPEGTPEVPNTEQGYKDYVDTVLPKLRVLNVEHPPSEFDEIKVQLTLNGVDLAKPGVRIFANAESGYLNKREALTDANGVARFRARRMDLEPADDMVVEFGFKFWKNLANVNIPQR